MSLKMLRAKNDALEAALVLSCRASIAKRIAPKEDFKIDFRESVSFHTAQCLLVIAPYAGCFIVAIFKSFIL
jgi:hypothetical protein